MRTALLALCLCAPAAADEVELTSGVVIEGRVQDLGDSIKVVKSGASIVYPKSMVRKITPKKTVEELYEEQSKALRENDAEGRLKLARWCLEKKLAKEAAAEFRKVVAVQPEHEEARLGAGFVKAGGKWMTEEEANLAKGLVRHKGRWMTPEEKRLDVLLDEQKELDRQLAERVKQLLEKVRSSDEKKRAEAADGLTKIEDKYKVKAYVEGVTSSYKLTRKFVYEELGRMKEPTAVKPLVRKSLWDDDEALRPAAWEALKAIAHPDTALFFVPFLGEASSSARLRAVESMAHFRDLRVVPYLAQALDNCMDQIKAMSEPQGGQPVTAMVTKTIIMGDGSTVQLPRAVRLNPNNPDKPLIDRLEIERGTIVSTLRSLTGQDIGADPRAWAAWYAKKKNE
jgi:hypothetical protein